MYVHMYVYIFMYVCIQYVSFEVMYRSKSLLRGPSAVTHMTCR